MFDIADHMFRNTFDPKSNKRLSKDFMSHKLYDSDMISERMRRFFKIGYIDRENTLQGCKEFLFFTRPNLYLFNSIPEYRSPGRVDMNDLHPSIRKNSPLLCSLYSEVPYLFYQLSRKFSGNMSFCGNFIPLLTNSVVSSLDLPGIDATYTELNKTNLGASRNIRGNSLASNNTFDFSLEFSDNKYLEIYKLAKIYDEYINLKYSGLLDIMHDPTNPKSGINHDMFSDLIDNVDSDVFSIYRILVGSNGEDIIHWSKLVGVSISNVPRDVISADMGDDGRLSIPLSFKADHVIDLDPMILVDFNKVGGVYYMGSPTIPTPAKTWDSESYSVSGVPVGTPFIIERDPDGNRFGGTGEHKPTYYKLKFKKI